MTLKSSTPLSTHFTAGEIAECRCLGRLAGCRHFSYVPELVAGAELLRTLGFPHGLEISSGYRCPAHNAAVGGARFSQHQRGTAIDIPLVLTLKAVQDLGVFSGIGWQYVGRWPVRRQLVRHVDFRHLFPATNITKGRAHAPTVWQYAA